MRQSLDNHIVPMTSFSSGKGREVLPDLYYYTNQIVNVVFVGKPDGPWVLIDAGMPHSGEVLLEAAQHRFGTRKPSVILLTHGHFDHIGGIVRLLQEWPDVPVYAHRLELPFLSGEADYPAPDPGVEGGMLAKFSILYPHKAIDIRTVLRALPEDHAVPGLPDWKWVPTPGHSPGHVSFFRETDGALVAGDAFVTVKADAFYKVLIQKKEVCGPPVYLTTDWDAAKASVMALAALNPQLSVTGHGTHMEGEALRDGLKHLCDTFDNEARPRYGKYVDGP
jgi:glyoxylase-like metal-dependent hydrolase (beta-lactamase superfamily II)